MLLTIIIILNYECFRVNVNKVDISDSIITVFLTLARWPEKIR